MAGIAVVNGWQRLGVVASIMIGFPSALVAYGINNSAFANIYVGTDPGWQGDRLTRYVRDQAISVNPETFKNCDMLAFKVEPGFSEGSYNVTCTNRPGFALGVALGSLAIAFAIVFGIGHTIAWIRRGFRRPK